MKLVGQRKRRWPGEVLPLGMVRIHRDFAEKILIENGDRPFSWLGQLADRKMTSFVDLDGCFHSVPAERIGTPYQGVLTCALVIANFRAEDNSKETL